jgi:hypothetical protein
MNNFDRFKLLVIHLLSLLGFLLFSVRYGWEQVEGFVKWLHHWIGWSQRLKPTISCEVALSYGFSG